MHDERTELRKESSLMVLQRFERALVRTHALALCNCKCNTTKFL